jgi:DNA uptake protein ComE-like DNA-binding protein
MTHARNWQKFLAKQALRGLDVLEGRLSPLKLKLQQDPHYRFRSLEEVQSAVRLGVQIDANRATTDDWLRLPGLSIHQARTLAQLTQSGVMLTCLEDVAAVLGLPLQRLAPLAEILQFCYYDAGSAVQGQTISVNRATVEQLSSLPGMDDALARILVYYRQVYGPYRDWVDLKQRLRLSPQVITMLLHYLRF